MIVKNVIEKLPPQRKVFGFQYKHKIDLENKTIRYERSGFGKLNHHPLAGLNTLPVVTESFKAVVGLVETTDIKSQRYFWWFQQAQPPKEVTLYFALLQLHHTFGYSFKYCYSSSCTTTLFFERRFVPVPSGTSVPAPSKL